MCYQYYHNVIGFVDSSQIIITQIIIFNSIFPKINTNQDLIRL